MENGTHPVFTPTQTVSNASFNAESSGECSLSHIYMEHGERDSKLHDGLYTYVTKPSIMGGFPKGCAPSIKSPKRVLRGYPDGKGRSVQAKGVLFISSQWWVGSGGGVRVSLLEGEQERGRGTNKKNHGLK